MEVWDGWVNDGLPSEEHETECLRFGNAKVKRAKCSTFRAAHDFSCEWCGKSKPAKSKAFGRWSDEFDGFAYFCSARCRTQGR